MEEEMDLESMKRRDLQRLCKKLGISSNSTNSAMVVSLRSIFQKQKNSKPKGCLKGSGGSSGEGLKKVTFVLDEEEDGVEILGFGVDHGGRTSRRRSRVPDAPVRSMRSGGLAESVLWSPVIEKKRARVGKQAVCGNSEEEVPLPLQKSLRNRVVEVGGDEHVVLGKRPRDVSEAVGQKKKLKKQAKDGEAVSQAARRTTRSSSGSADEEVSWDGETTLEKPSKGVKVNKLATEPVRRSTCSTSSSQEEPFDCKTAVKNKHVKQVNIRDSEVVTEPVRRMTRSSVNLGRDEVGKLGGEAVRKGKSKRQAKAHVSRGGESAVPVSDTEVVIPSTRKSTRSSSKLLDDDIPSLGVGKPRKQGKKHVTRSGDSEVSMSDSEAVISPTKRTRSSSRLMEDDISLPAVGKPPQAKKHASRRGDLEVTVPDTDSVISPMRRTTRSSSLLLENEKSLPEHGKAQQQAKKHVLSRGQSNVSVSNSEAVISPTKRSTRSSSKMLADESSLLVVGKLGAEEVRNKSGKQAKKECASKASLSESEAVNAPTRRMTGSSALEDEASLTVSGKYSVDTEAVKKYKSAKQAKNHASNQGVSSALVLDSKFVAQSTRRPTRRSANNSSILGKPEDNKAVRGDKPSKQSKKRASKQGTLTASLVDGNSVAQPARRSTRSSPMHDSLGDGTYLPLRRKLDDDGEAVYTNKSEKQVRSLRSRKGDEPEQEISLSVGGDSVNKAENGTRKKIQKQHGDQDLKEAASKAYVSDSKIGAELEGSEVHKNIGEPPRRTTRSASKHGESHIMPVGVTASDRIVETSSKKKRTRAGDLENVSVGMRETVELGSLGIHNAGSRKSSRKSLRNVPTESETVRRESSPETAVRLLEETVKASSVKSWTPGKQISSYKQSSSIFETEDDQTLTSSENHEKNDHNIVGGDKAKALELHEVMHTTENVPLLFSGPTPSIDLYVTGETDAGNEVHDVNEKNVSELSFPAPIKLLEAEKGTALEGNSNINQSICVQEWHDERTSSVNHETEDHNIVSGDVVKGSVSHEVVNCSENVSLPESSSGALSVELSIAVETDGVEIQVNDVIVGNCSQLQQSPVTEQSQEVEKGILLDGPSNSEQQSLKQELKVDGEVASSGNQDLEDHSIVGKDQAGVAEAHKAIPIVEIETTDVVTEKSMPGVDRSPVFIQLQEVENILSFEGARNASATDCHSYDPSEFSSGNHYKTVDGTSLVVDSDTGEISNLWSVSHIEMESSGADLDGEADKVAKETPVVGSDGDVEEVKETCQSPTLFVAKNDGEKAEAEVPPSSLGDSTTFGLRLGDQVTDHGTQQAGLDCGSYKVSEETACNRDSPLSGAVTAEAKVVCLMPILSLLESDGAGTVGNQINGEIGESSFHSEDVKSTESSVISKGMGTLTDATLCGDSEKVVEAKDTPAVALHNSGEGVAAEFSSSISMAGEVFSDQRSAINVAQFVNNNNSGDVTKGPIETEDVSLVGSTEASLPYSEAYDAPSRTNDVEKVVYDYPSSATGSGGLDREAIMHSDQQRNPGDSSPDLASADYEVVPQVTVGPTHELLDAKFKGNLGLTDVVVEEIESRESLKGEASDGCEDLSVKELDTTVVDKFGETILEQGDAYEEEIECRGSLEGETTDDCKDLSAKELDTTVVDKFGETILEQGDAYEEEIECRGSLEGETTDDCKDLSAKELDTTVVDKFGETILEQGDAYEEEIECRGSLEGETTDDCKDLSAKELDTTVVDKFGETILEQGDASEEEIECRGSLEGETTDDCKDLSAKELSTTVVDKFGETILEQGGASKEEIECRGSLEVETTDDSKDLSVKELDTTVVDKFGETILEQGDAYVEGIGSRESLKGEASDDFEDLSVKEHDTTVVDKFGVTILEQGDASELQVPLETSREPKTSDFSSHGTFETPECQDSSPSERVLPVEDFSLSENVENEHVDKENAQGTSAEEKMVKEENNIEDDTIMVKEDNISVDEFDEVREQCGAFLLAPLNRVVLQTAEDASSAHIETPASQVPSLHKVEVFLSDGHVGQENVENASSEEVAFSEGHLSSPRPSANLGEGQDSATLRKENFFLERPGYVEEPAGDMVVLSSKPVSKLDNEKAVQEKNETGILCNAHAVEQQEDRLGVTRDADEDVSQTKAESLLEASVNIEEPIFCSTSGSKYSKSVDTFQCEGAGVYEKSTHLCLNSIGKAPHCTGQLLVVGQQEQITAGTEADSSIKNESYTNHKVDILMPGMNQYDREIGIHEVEKLPPKSGESLVGNQDLISIETEEVSAIEVGKVSPQYISAGIKELSANEDEKSSPTSVPSLVGLQVQTSMDIQGFSATGTDDRVEKAPVVNDTMELLFAPFHYNACEDASTGYTEQSEDKLDSWVFGDMADDMDLTEVSDELNYRAARQGEVGVSSKRQGEFNRFEHSPVSRSVQPRAEEAGPSQMYLDDLFCMDDEGTNILNDSGHVDQWEKRLDEEKSHFNEGENYLEVNSMKEAGERKEMKSMCFSRNFDAESKEALFFASEAFAEAENVSASHQVQEGKSSSQGNEG
ncbi:uncharacterized protein M6B38_394155 [Iris pallida]|uniref:SAP domain-containing protein n=1 Tax=Iris pallida TaxID=29817 RepID=A0AAX6FXT7_IRIPA|nr:uncharacterized protein M6B38_394155 [Iris pallida]